MKEIITKVEIRILNLATLMINTKRENTKETQTKKTSLIIPIWCFCFVMLLVWKSACTMNNSEHASKDIFPHKIWSRNADKSAGTAATPKSLGTPLYCSQIYWLNWPIQTSLLTLFISSRNKQCTVKIKDFKHIAINISTLEIICVNRP